MSNNVEIKHKLNSLVCIITRIYFLLKLQITQKLKLLCTVMHCERNITFEWLLSYSVSVPTIFFKKSLVTVCLRENVWWRINVLFKKDVVNVVLSQEKDLIKIVMKFRTKKILHTFASRKKKFVLGNTKYHTWKRLCNNTLKRNNLEVYISLKSNKWTCLANM